MSPYQRPALPNRWDAGLWAWDRRDGSVFVAPLVAVTLARFGAVTAGRPRSNHAVFV
jgi:hypothetical protein